MTVFLGSNLVYAHNCLEWIQQGVLNAPDCANSDATQIAAGGAMLGGITTMTVLGIQGKGPLGELLRPGVKRKAGLLTVPWFRPQFRAQPSAISKYGKYGAFRVLEDQFNTQLDLRLRNLIQNLLGERHYITVTDISTTTHEGIHHSNGRAVDIGILSDGEMEEVFEYVTSRQKDLKIRELYGPDRVLQKVGGIYRGVYVSPGQWPVGPSGEVYYPSGKKPVAHDDHIHIAVGE